MYPAFQKFVPFLNTTRHPSETLACRRVSIRKDYPEAEWLTLQINEELKKLRESGYLKALENDSPLVL